MCIVYQFACPYPTVLSTQLLNARHLSAGFNPGGLVQSPPNISMLSGDHMYYF